LSIKGAAVNEPTPSFCQRIFLAFRVFFHVVANPEFASRAARLEAGGRVSADLPPRAPSSFMQMPPDAALQLLGLLQQEGRFIDFVEEDVSGFSDADIGAAARVVHQGCRKAVRDHFKIAPIRTEQEGSEITLEEGFDPSSIRLAGNVVGKPPYKGSLIHRGWRVSEAALPKVAAGHDVRVLAAAEVEL
jgi:hypothetical protein